MASVVEVAVVGGHGGGNAGCGGNIVVGDECRYCSKSRHGCTPYEVWHGVKPYVHHLRMFGCVAHVKQGNKRLSKLQDRSTSMVFIGYEGGSKAWHFYNPSTEHIHISWNAVFEEDHAWEWGDDKSGNGAEPFVVDYFSVGDVQLLGQADQR
jgi:hypothetical protein